MIRFVFPLLYLLFLLSSCLTLLSLFLCFLFLLTLLYSHRNLHRSCYIPSYCSYISFLLLTIPLVANLVCLTIHGLHGLLHYILHILLPSVFEFLPNCLLYTSLLFLFFLFYSHFLFPLLLY